VSLVRPDLFLAAWTVWARDTLRLLRKLSCPSCVQTYSWHLGRSGHETPFVCCASSRVPRASRPILGTLDGLGTRHPSFAAQTLVSLVRPDLFLRGAQTTDFVDPRQAGEGAQAHDLCDPPDKRTVSCSQGEQSRRYKVDIQDGEEGGMERCMEKTSALHPSARGSILGRPSLALPAQALGLDVCPQPAKSGAHCPSPRLQPGATGVTAASASTCRSEATPSPHASISGS
jgi:hypothetical protein